MSTQSIEFRHAIEWSAVSNARVQREMPREKVVASRFPYEELYRVMHNPPPTPEEVRREYFLLECD